MNKKIFCSKCGRENTTEDNFCVGCGSKLSINQNNDDVVEKPVKVRKTSQNQKNGIIPGIILIVIGIAFLVSDILPRLGLVNVSVDAGISQLVLGIAFCIYGAVLSKIRFKQYGWGIGAIIGLCVAVSAMYPFDKSALMAGMVLLAVCLGFFLKANLKK